MSGRVEKPPPVDSIRASAIHIQGTAPSSHFEQNYVQRRGLTPLTPTFPD